MNSHTPCAPLKGSLIEEYFPSSGRKEKAKELVEHPGRVRKPTCILQSPALKAAVASWMAQESKRPEKLGERVTYESRIYRTQVNGDIFKGILNICRQKDESLSKEMRQRRLTVLEIAFSEVPLSLERTGEEGSPWPINPNRSIKLMMA